MNESSGQEGMRIKQRETQSKISWLLLCRRIQIWEPQVGAASGVGTKPLLTENTRKSGLHNRPGSSVPCDRCCITSLCKRAQWRLGFTSVSIKKKIKAKNRNGVIFWAWLTFYSKWGRRTHGLKLWAHMTLPALYHQAWVGVWHEFNTVHKEHSNLLSVVWVNSKNFMKTLSWIKAAESSAFNMKQRPIRWDWSGEGRSS